MNVPPANSCCNRTVIPEQSGHQHNQDFAILWSMTVTANGEKEYRMYGKLKNMNKSTILCKENSFLFTEYVIFVKKIKKSLHSEPK